MVAKVQPYRPEMPDNGRVEKIAIRPENVGKKIVGTGAEIGPAFRSSGSSSNMCSGSGSVCSGGSGSK